MNEPTRPSRPEIRIMLPESMLSTPPAAGIPLNHDMLERLVCQETCNHLTELFPDYDVVVTHGRVAEPIVVAGTSSRETMAFERQIRSALTTVPDVTSLSPEEIEARLGQLRGWAGVSGEEG